MYHYRKLIIDPEPIYDKYETNEVYVDKMQKILSAYPCIGVPREPSPIYGAQVYVGSSADAENIPLLKSLGINFILNCESSGLIRHRRAKELYPPETGVLGYEELPLEDNDYFSLRCYFDRAHVFIEHARARNGKVLIHCPAASRSGAIAISYLVKAGIPLLEATKRLKDKRRVALTNTNFMQQLVVFARERGMLESDVETVPAPVYDRRINSYRINSAHLPLFV